MLFKVNLVVPLNSFKQEELKKTKTTKKRTHLLYSTQIMENVIWMIIRYMPHMGFPGGTVVKNLPANAVDKGLTPGLGRSPEERNGKPL